MKHIAKTKKTQIYVRSLLAIAVSMSLFCTACAARPQPRAEGESAEAQDELSESALSPESAASPLVSPEPSDGKEPESEAMEKGAETSVSLFIEEYYITNTGYTDNLYYIDERGVLWGSGSNRYGQLGQGNQDTDFHEDLVKIAEDVIHVDYSQSGFAIYLTKDHKLYGMGNAGCGALQQFRELDPEAYANGEMHTVNMPLLLMEDVAYARCGRDDVVCMTQDRAVWVWGTIVYGGAYSQMPVKVLEKAALVTGGAFSHAALLQDGSVWTWGYNYAGNCGVADISAVNSPTQVAEGAVMVWTGSAEDNIDCQDISELRHVNPRGLENTIVLKEDGTYRACGMGLGTEKTLKYYWGLYDYSAVCTSEFVQVDGEQVFSPDFAWGQSFVDSEDGF
ncbi:MAG: hypothetical protein HFH94_11035 [Lachnospiraceae bacterium]|nr:hypothetical protein [uncultured Acetatifactor sp.]MCI9220253.1 hypothetical protein [Lachnospiraceae bacterium]